VTYNVQGSDGEHDGSALPTIRAVTMQQQTEERMQHQVDSKFTRRGGKTYCLPMLAGILLLTTRLAVAVDDTTPPSVVSLDFNPKSVDVTTSAQNVTVTMHVTDDLSGTAFITATFTSPSYAQYQYAGVYRSAGTALDGTFTGTVTIPKFSESGTWSLSSVYLGDNAGNTINLSQANLQTAGFPTSLSVTSVQDTAAPQVNGTPVFSPPSLDVSGGAQTLTVTFNLTDDLSGVSFSQQDFALILVSPSGRQQQYVPSSEFQLISGNTLNGQWQITHTFPQYSEAGTWSIAYIYLKDSAGNQNYISFFGDSMLPATFTVVSSPQDITPPTITSFDFSPKVIDTSAGAQTVTVTMGIVDNLAGADFSPDTPYLSYYHGFNFFSPSHGQSVYCCGYSPIFTLTAGTPTNGTWQAAVSIPRFSEEGTWKASIYLVKDAVRNVLNLSTAQLAAMSFPTDLVVVKPSLVSDGSAGPAGGTVMDSTFGDRAEIIFPPGVLSTTTQVAIDVFQSPLDIPLPTGFSAYGTRFVNINLTPPPSEPLPAPGITLVLPLPQMGTPGDPIYLFSVSIDGTLVPVLDTSGMPVIGTVDPSGLSATFTGVSHASIFVGLIHSSVPPTGTPTNTAVPPTATKTNTPVPPTATPTNTPVPPTATKTNTPVPPTATKTNTAVPPTATPTNTSVPPTPTKTNTPGGVNQPDLLTTAVSNPPASLKRGKDFKVTDTVLNQGPVKAGPSTTRYYLSFNGSTLAKRLMGERHVPGLNPNSTSTGSVQVKIPPDTQPGGYFLIACADDKGKVKESNEANNCTSSAGTVQVVK
jgi:hypothetical protein